MRKAVTSTALFAVLAFVIGCTKESNLLPSPQTSSNQFSIKKPSICVIASDGYLDKKPILRFRWGGIERPGEKNPCGGGECGLCPGICLIFKWQLSKPRAELSKAEINDGLGTASVKPLGQFLFMKPDANCDDGTGHVTISRNYDIGTDFSHVLGHDHVIIKEGKYKIHYSEESRYGEIQFNVINK